MDCEIEKLRDAIHLEIERARLDQRDVAEMLEDLAQQQREEFDDRETE